MIKCVAIDDEPKALEVIKNHVARVDFLALLDTFTDPYAAISFVNDHAVALVFLDINMPDINGLQLSKYFKVQPFIIFTTAHSEYALASYELEAIDYLLKPFDFPRFLSAVNKVKERIDSISKFGADFFFVNTGNQRMRLFYIEISHVQSEGNYVTYFTRTDKILVRASLSQTIGLLPAAMFVQIHRSFIVSLQWIEKIEDNHVFVAGHKIAISTTYREKFMARINSLQR